MKEGKRNKFDYNDLVKEAAALGLELNWSPINQSYFLESAPPGYDRQLKAVKNTLEEVKYFLEEKKMGKVV